MINVLITGASSGLGLVTTKYLCELGYHIHAGIRDINGNNLEASEKLIKYSTTSKGDISPVEIDLASEESIERCVETLKNTTPKLDALINNAGLGAMG